MKVVTYVILEDGEEIIGLFQNPEKAVAYANRWQARCYDSDWDVAITIERRLYTPEEIRKILEDF